MTSSVFMMFHISSRLFVQIRNGGRGIIYCAFKGNRLNPKPHIQHQFLGSYRWMFLFLLSSLDPCADRHHRQVPLSQNPHFSLLSPCSCSSFLSSIFYSTSLVCFALPDVSRLTHLCLTSNLSNIS